MSKMAKGNARSVAWLGVGISLASYALLAWDREFHPLVSDSTSRERWLGLALWLTVLIVYYVAVPVFLVGRPRLAMRATWPVAEVILLSSGIALVALFFDFLPRWPELFNSDLELGFILYLAASISFIFSVGRCVSGWRSMARFTRASCAAVTLFAGILILAISGTVVYLE